MSNNGIANRRRHPRLEVPPMYTAITIQAPDFGRLEGHAYDVSEGGVQFELDQPLEPGTRVEITLELPNSFGYPQPANPREREVHAVGNIIWVDQSEPGPVRLALAFTRFQGEDDQARLLDRIRRVVTGRLAA
jgi:hypothetical protein